MKIGLGIGLVFKKFEGGGSPGIPFIWGANVAKNWGSSSGKNWGS